MSEERRTPSDLSRHWGSSELRVITWILVVVAAGRWLGSLEALAERPTRPRSETGRHPG